MVTERRPFGTPPIEQPGVDAGPRVRPDLEPRSIGDLARQLTTEASTLIRQEIQLAKLEMSEKLSRMARNATYLVIGGLLGYAGLLALIQAAINGLGVGIWREDNNWIWLAVWLAPLVIGLLVAGIAYVFVRKGISTLKKESMVPEKTLETMRENKQWLENQVK